MDSIKNILPSSLLRNKIKPQVEACNVLDEFRHLVRNVWGAEVVVMAEPQYLKEGILVVKCSSSTVSAALFMAKKKIIEEINKKMESDVVKDIMFRI